MGSVFKLRYPMRIGGELYPALTQVALLHPNDPRVQEHWPGISLNNASTQMAVLLPFRDQPIIVKRDQLMEEILHACPLCGQLSTAEGPCADCQRDAYYT